MAEQERAIEIADQLHSAAIHLLRRVRRQDTALGLSAARLSALSVIVFAGPITIGELARAEQVRPPTMTRLVGELCRAGWVRRQPHPEDKRSIRLHATESGRSILSEGRRRRVALLAQELAAIPAKELEILARAAELLRKVLDR